MNAQKTPTTAEHFGKWLRENNDDGQYRRTYPPPHGGPYSSPGFAHHGTYLASTSTTFMPGLSGLSGPPGFPGAPAAPPRKPLKAAIRAGEITAHRAWWLRDGFLYSMAMQNYRWAPGDIERAKEVTDYGQCGIYAFKDHHSVEQNYKATSSVYDVVFGRIEMWGEVIEHNRGYRAEFAEIVAIDGIWPKPSAWPLNMRFARRNTLILGEVRKLYGV